MDFKKIHNLSGWLVFAIATIVFYSTAESTGSLWDCGEFIAGAYKFEVVHPPGAAVFLILGRMFTLVAELFSGSGDAISFSVNVMSGVSTAFMAAFVCWSAGIFAKMSLVGRSGTPSSTENIVIAAAGIVAGLASAFCTSIWFSAVEGEVYGLSTFFTALVVWAMVKWYHLPDTPQADRWIVFAIYMAGISTGVHLLSLLTFPALALFYYFKKYKEHSILGMFLAAAAGVGLMGFIQVIVILGIPKLWSWFDLFAVNTLGMPLHSGLLFVFALFAGGIYLGTRYAERNKLPNIQKALFTLSLVIVGFSTVGVVVIRANADTPINMNDPSNAMRLVPYLNREQYGERPLLFGPHFDAPVVGYNKVADRYDYVDGEYRVVDQKIEYEYNSKDKMFFPRLGHTEGSRPALYKQRWQIKSPPSMGDNIGFFVTYQLRWMYWRYFMWNFSGRQNGDQGYYPWDANSGHWITGINFIDNMLVHNMDELTDTQKNDPARNTYFMLPFIFGLIGMFYHFRKRQNDALAVLALFLMTGVAIIVYSNQPPNEPRERDYVLVGSFFTYCMWIGLAVPAVYELLRERFNMSGIAPAAIAGLAIATAPLIMFTQNLDDHNRNGHYGAKDYASNFLNSLDENAIIFTYGDNDTYPLWYVQEVQGIRTDVRVVNLSLIQVDWYIHQLMRKVNDSEPLKFTVSKEAYRGQDLSQILYLDDDKPDQAADLGSILQFVGSKKVKTPYLPTRRMVIPVDKGNVLRSEMVRPLDRDTIENQIIVNVPLKGRSQKYILKGDLAMLDIIHSNYKDRPIYFATTIPNASENMMGFKDYTQLEGLALRLVPVKTKADSRFAGMQSLSLGNVHTDKVYDNIMNRWKWGNFDKKDTYINEKYGPSLQSMRMIFLRGIRASLDENKKDKAVELVDKFFESFPHFNFPYDYSTFEFLRSYADAGAWDKAKPHIEILANELEQKIEFVVSLDDSTLDRSGYLQAELSTALQTANNLIALSSREKDEAMKNKLRTMFEPYRQAAEQGER